jgi:cation-transporting ATPase 13A1
MLLLTTISCFAVVTKHALFISSFLTSPCLTLLLFLTLPGRPWTKSISENTALLWSVAGLYAGLVVLSWEVLPVANSYMGLVPLPDGNFRVIVLALLAVSVCGTFMWDRLCLYLFAREVHMAARAETQVRWADIAGSAKKIGVAVGVFAVIGVLDLGLPGLIGLYFAWRKYKSWSKEQADKAAAGVSGVVAAAAGAAPAVTAA